VVRGKLSDHLQRRAGLVRPAWENSQKENLPLRYAWKDIEPQLRALADSPGSPYDGVALEYINPMTGGPTLATLSCWIQLLRPGEHTKKHRHTSSAVYFVVGGEGTTTVGEKTMDWTKNDCFAVPNWAWHEHFNRSKSEEALLFSVNDAPIVSAFGHYREEPENSLHRTAVPAVPAPMTK
jgi:gentisate 1,2-dioxygenase